MIEAHLLKLEEMVSFLRTLAAADRAVVRDSLRDMLAAERVLQVGTQIIIDTGSHILSACGTKAVDYDDILRQLALRGVVSTELRVRLDRLGSLHSILVRDHFRVHDHFELDPNRVLDGVARAPQDFGDYIDAIRAWIDSQSPGR